MHINKQSLHYKLYQWTYEAWDRAVPKNSNLCQYVQRVFWMSFFTALWSALLSAAYVLVAAPIMLLFGFRPVNVWEDHIISSRRFATKYPGLKLGPPVPPQFDLYPWHVLLPSLFVFLEWLWFHYKPWYYPVFIQLFLLALFGFLVFWLWIHDGYSESAVIVRNWFSAKKQGVCPLVEFDDQPTSKDIT